MNVAVGVVAYPHVGPLLRKPVPLMVWHVVKWVPLRPHPCCGRVATCLVASLRLDPVPVGEETKVENRYLLVWIAPTSCVPTAVVEKVVLAALTRK